MFNILYILSPAISEVCGVSWKLMIVSLVFNIEPASKTQLTDYWV